MTYDPKPQSMPRDNSELSYLNQVLEAEEACFYYYQLKFTVFKVANFPKE